MDVNSFRPAREFAMQFGCKAVIYGRPGSGKSPITITTSPNPCVLMCEPGFLSLRKSDVPTFPAFTPARLREFFAWFLQSSETSKFDTLVVDSWSQLCEILLEEQLAGSTKGGNKAHGQAAYGEMSRQSMEWLNKLYFMPKKHIALICKLQRFEDDSGVYRRPYFPGRELHVKVPHLFDFVLELGDFNVPGVEPSPTKAFRTKEEFDAMARDRSGNLAMYEPPHLGNLFKKAMAS